VAIEKSFTFDIGPLDPGEWEILALWTDPPDVDVAPIRIEVGEEACLDGAHIGDFNSDESFDIADPVALLAHLFRGGDAPCREAGDYDRDRELQVTDAI